MAVQVPFTSFVNSLLSFPPHHLPARSSKQLKIRACLPTMEFPYSSPPIRRLMVDLISTVESTLGTCLLQCTLPQNVQYYHNQSNTSHGSLQIRSGSDSSPVDFILSGWLHCQLPSGADLSITTLSAYLDCSTHAPHFLIELIQSSPTSLVLILDLLPRKDLLLDPGYIKTYYEDTELDRERDLISKIPEVTPYISSSLYARCVCSPTGILVRVDTTDAETMRMEEIVEDEVSSVAKRVLQIWLERCFNGDFKISSDDAAALKRRDGVIKKKTIEMDLGSSLPRLFGQDVADRVLEAIHGFFNA